MSDKPSSITSGYVKGNLDLVKNWNGIISPEGKFYKTTMRNDQISDLDITIEEVSKNILNIDLLSTYRELQQSNIELLNKELLASEIIVNIKGYVIYNYTDNKLKIIRPKPKINHKHMTGEQIETLYDLIFINNDKCEDFCDCFDEKIENVEYQSIKKYSA